MNNIFNQVVFLVTPGTRPVLNKHNPPFQALGPSLLFLFLLEYEIHGPGPAWHAEEMQWMGQCVFEILRAGSPQRRCFSSLSRVPSCKLWTRVTLIRIKLNCTQWPLLYECSPSTLSSLSESCPLPTLCPHCGVNRLGSQHFSLLPGLYFSLPSPAWKHLEGRTFALF